MNLYNLGHIIVDAIQNLPKESHEEYMNNLQKYKDIIDRSPLKFLKFHLETAIKDERYELAEYIKNKMLFYEIPT